MKNRFLLSLTGAMLAAVMALPAAATTDAATEAAIKQAIAGSHRNPDNAARDQYRRDIDYSAVFFLIFWGLNVVDAAVDAHLKGFDVSPDLTLHVKPTLSQMAFTNGPALSFVFDIGKKKFIV